MTRHLKAISWRKSVLEPTSLAVDDGNPFQYHILPWEHILTWCTHRDGDFRTDSEHCKPLSFFQSLAKTREIYWQRHSRISAMIRPWIVTFLRKSLFEHVPRCPMQSMMKGHFPWYYTPTRCLHRYGDIEKLLSTARTTVLCWRSNKGMEHGLMAAQGNPLSYGTTIYDHICVSNSLIRFSLQSMMKVHTFKILHSDSMFASMWRHWNTYWALQKLLFNLKDMKMTWKLG